MFKKNDEFFLAFLVRYLEEGTDRCGPFAAFVVQNNEIIGYGRNLVVAAKDPTAHAEIVAIRDACRTLGTHNLAYCTLYASCEPCPMCTAAIYWAGISRVVYVATAQDADNIGFMDKAIKHEVKLDPMHRGRPFMQAERFYPEVLQLMTNWKGQKY